MNVRTPGIVIKSSRYSNSSLITKIYTQTHGLLSFVIKGAYRPKSRLPVSFFQPLQVLSLEISYRQNRNFQNISEAQAVQSTYSLTSSPFKVSISIFIAELIDHCLSVGSENDEVLFDFLKKNVEYIEQNKPSTNFPLFFMVQLSRHLGILPENNYAEETPWFSVSEGKFVADQPEEFVTLSITENKYLSELLQSDRQNYHTLSIPNAVKRRLLFVLDNYFGWHLPGYSRLKSYSILTDVIE